MRPHRTKGKCSVYKYVLPSPTVTKQSLVAMPGNVKRSFCLPQTYAQTTLHLLYALHFKSTAWFVRSSR